MAIDFPPSPTVGQSYTYNSQTWEWTGQYWDSRTNSGSGGGCTADSIPPPSPSVGDMWYDTTTGRTYIWYDSVWSEMTGTPSFVDASTLLGTTMAPNVVNYPSHTVLRQGGTTEGGQIDLQGGTSYPALAFIDRYQDDIRFYSDGAIPLSVRKNLVTIGSSDDVNITATDDVFAQAGDLATLAGAAGATGFTADATGVKLNPGSGRVYLNARSGYLPLNMVNYVNTSNVTVGTGDIFVANGAAVGAVKAGDMVHLHMQALYLVNTQPAVIYGSIWVYLDGVQSNAASMSGGWAQVGYYSTLSGSIWWEVPSNANACSFAAVMHVNSGQVTTLGGYTYVSAAVFGGR